MQTFQLIALTLPGLLDPSVAIAACRAGELGVLNLEHAQDVATARAAVTRMARYAGRMCGIRINSDTLSFNSQVVDDLPKRVGVVILTAHDPETLRQQVADLRQRGLTVLLEVTCFEQAQLGAQLGVDGLIAKGNEAGGWVGDETAFILLQQLLSRLHLPVWAQGGIGLHTLAACYAAGAAGAVLDSQLALTRESPLPTIAKRAIATMDGSETVCLGGELNQRCRVYTRPGLPVLEELRRMPAILTQNAHAGAEAVRKWRQAVEARIGWDSLQESLWPLGQEASFADSLAQRYRTVGGVLGAMREAVSAHVSAVQAARPLDDGAPLAVSHGTRYPIVQGPMTRVSDRAEFALRVAEGGALPFLALALMRAPEISSLLGEVKRTLRERPWGVGILGFVPLDLRQEQMDVIRHYRPPFALIAGGRPDQARALGKDGIPTYLHVPSPGLLRLFLEDGARRFVFEGRECGGHVGPRSSFVLWNSMINVLLEELPAREEGNVHVLFAGGIHDALSASMVATMAAPLASQGVRVGVLLGTSYLYTQEAVATGAILAGFQEEALRCQRTVLLESGAGHAIRCAESPYVELFQKRKQQMLQDGKSPDEIRQILEEMNLGRLRIASKGITRHPRYGQDPETPKFVSVSEEEQHNQGMYMIGQLAALRDRTCTIAELHNEVAIEGSRRLESLRPSAEFVSASVPAVQPSKIAIIGMSCLLPKAQDLRSYWENILGKVNSIAEIPKERWDAELYFDPDREARDKIYSKWGGFIDDVPFNPIEFGMPPNSLPSIDPMHLLALVAVREALADAGYSERPFDRSRTSVIFGASGGVGDLGAGYVLRSGLPLLYGDAGFNVAANSDGVLPEWTEDSFAGLLLNVAAGRVANRFDFGGLNYVVDAACASSLTAVHLAVKELETYNTDIVITGGVDTVQNPFGYLCFSKTQALSPTGQPRVFDAAADGIVISEGVVILVLKRLADAERDGDRIYAVIQSVAGSSDGRGMGMTAPRPEGQSLAFQRAYAKAGISPTTVGLFEAHGTGTVVGDRTEALSLSTFLEAAGAEPRNHAIGSIKSMIGHTKATAGVAGLAKVALALHHKVLPPTLGVTQPNPKAQLEEGPLYVNSETRPWIHSAQDYPRRAGVSAFGFGGTNFHAVVEEYVDGFLGNQYEAVSQGWPSELLLWSAESREDLQSRMDRLEQTLALGATPKLRDLAYSLWLQMVAGDPAGIRLAIVASSLQDLQQKLSSVRSLLNTTGPVQLHDPRGIYLWEELQMESSDKVAFLFPGQGSQYPNMLRDLAIHFSEVREAFERTDQVLAQRFPKPLSEYVFPPPVFTPEDERVQRQALMQTNVAQPALGVADLAVFQLLGRLGVQPDFVAGHSYGEYAALCAAGVIDSENLAILSEARGRSIIEAAEDDLGTMAAVHAGQNTIMPVVEIVEGVWIANLNAPEQTIISGTREGIAEAVKRFEEKGISARLIPVACAFHSPLVAPAQQRLEEVLSRIDFSSPELKVFSNTTAAPYPYDPEAIRDLLAKHLVFPVCFADEIEAMYAAGARVFVEAGPRNVLTGLVKQTLGERPHLVVNTDMPRRNGLTQLQHALGQLSVHGLELQLDRLFRGRQVRRLRLDALVEETKEEALLPTSWLVNGSRARPLNALQDGLGPSPMEPTTLRTVEDSDEQAGHDQLKNPSLAGAPAAEPRVPTTQELSISQTPFTGSQDGTEEVMLQYQQLMGRFLETQRNVMLAYLQGNQSGRLPVQDTVSEATATPAPVAPPQPAELVSEVTEPASVEPPTPEAAAVPDQMQLTQHLLQIVSERTGYPAEMLDLEVDIEADLGIDSIKRVEILSVLQRKCIPPDHQIGQEALEQLTGIKTLRGIVDWIEDALRAESDEATEKAIAEPQVPAPVEVGKDTAVHTDVVEGGTDSFEISRLVLRAQDAEPVGDRPVRFPPNRVMLLTDDGQGIAQTIAQWVRDNGGRATVVQLTNETGMRGDDGHQANLVDATAVEELVAMIRQREGPIGGIVHLEPLRDSIDFEAMDLLAWRERLRRDVKSLFLLVRVAAPDLKQAGKEEGAWLVAATAMGGTHAIDVSEQRSFFPGQGSVAGLVKTLALEWPTVRCKIIDFDLENPDFDPAQQLIQEMSADDGLVELGYEGSRRKILQPVPAPLDEGQPAPLTIESDWVLLVTGGARGITAEVALEVAKRYRPTLLLLGRSPLPQHEESPQTAGLTSPQELKAALMDQMRQGTEKLTLADVEAAYNRLIKDRAMRRNLEKMRRAGAMVRYYQADVRDEQVMADLVEGIYQEYGRLDGVIHGAGIIEDKLIEDKSPESFDRVFDTKADSAFILSRLLRPHSLKFLVLFSSAAGPFGNRGQCDYAAANEVLNKLAIQLDKRWPGRVVSINWGPWAKTGMVSPELQRQFTQRGVQLISMQTGRQAFDRELRYGEKGDAEVIVAGGVWGAPEERPGDRRTEDREDFVVIPQRPDTPAYVVFPLLKTATLSKGSGGSIEVVRVLDPSHDLYLRDHQLDGKPVLPVAMAIELMSEVAQQGWPDLVVVGLRDLSVFKGVILENGPKTVQLAARAKDGIAHKGARVDVDVQIKDPERPSHPFYRATIELADRLPDPMPHQPPFPDGLQAFPMTVDQAYRQWLFHGPLFRGITGIQGISEHGMVATCRPSSPRQCLTGDPRGQWLIDPVVFDSGLQLIILWARTYHDITPLPAGCKGYRRLGALVGPVVRCYLRARVGSDGHIVHGNLFFVGQDDRLLGVLEDLECTGSRALNRLAGQGQG